MSNINFGDPVSWLHWIFGLSMVVYAVKYCIIDEIIDSFRKKEKPNREE